MAYLSKLLDVVARGWPASIQAVAATATLLEDTPNPTLNGRISVHTSHYLRTVLSQKLLSG